MPPKITRASLMAPPSMCRLTATDAMAKSHTPRGRIFWKVPCQPSRGGGITISVRISSECSTWDCTRPAAHPAVVIAVVAEGAIADVAAVAPARVVAAQILAPHLLHDVARDGGLVAQRGR